MELDEFSDYVSELLDREIPPELLKGLNLGVIVSPKLVKSKKEADRITMGVYVKNLMGKQVILYYGSFMYMYEGRSEKFWKRKILSTLKHELTHHVEALAGQEDLAKKERADIERRKRKKKNKGLKKNKGQKKNKE